MKFFSMKWFSCVKLLKIDFIGQPKSGVVFKLIRRKYSCLLPPYQIDLTKQKMNCCRFACEE